jgi:ubiquinone/menaquinone biosynthesis C-methylase UbiE
MTNLWFRLMALEYRLKLDSDAVLATLRETGIQPGMNVLDFGCGPGRYTIPAAKLVGSHGVVYAVDVHPLAIKMLEKGAARTKLTNLRPIHSDCDSGLAPSSIDAVLLYDALHDVEDREAVLKELHRVLKPDGKVWYKDHTLNGEPLLSLMGACGFSLSEETPTQLAFKKS